MTVLSDSVTKGEDGWTFQCPGVQGSPCGAERPFTSSGWPTRKSAEARGAQHFAEHKGEGAMQSLEEFRKDQGIVVEPDGSVRLEDI